MSTLNPSRPRKPEPSSWRAVSITLDAWRQLAERGLFLRSTHVHDIMKSTALPRAAVQPKELEIAIAVLENDVHMYEAASSEKVTVPQRKFNLQEMCPEPFKKH